MGRLRDWWCGLPWADLEFRIIRRPYMSDKWQYFSQYFYHGKWRTVQNQGMYGHYDSVNWSEKEERDEIRALKRRGGEEIVWEGRK